VRSELRGLDADLVAESFAADRSVLESLLSNGDVPSLVREIDVAFRGDLASLDNLHADAPRRGWRVLQYMDDGSGEGFLNLARDQTTEVDAIETMTIELLSMARDYGVTYDGWGCVAKRRPS
jgi:regulator of RNase E activity RraB